MVVLVIAGVTYALLDTSKNYRITSQSMLPTYEANATVSVDESDKDPERNDVVLFYPPKGADLNKCGVRHPDNQACPAPTPERSDTKIIKRVVGLPGDKVSVVKGRINIDGEPQDESFIRPSADCGTCNLEKPITVPPDHYFVAGDNRGESADSREWGPVPHDNILGTATD